MRAEYDFSKSRKNPYARLLKSPNHNPPGQFIGRVLQGNGRRTGDALPEPDQSFSAGLRRSQETARHCVAADAC